MQATLSRSRNIDIQILPRACDLWLKRQSGLASSTNNRDRILRVGLLIIPARVVLIVESQSRFNLYAAFGQATAGANVQIIRHSPTTIMLQITE
jgi:hypothetical protein